MRNNNIPPLAAMILEEGYSFPVCWLIEIALILWSSVHQKKVWDLPVWLQLGVFTSTQWIPHLQSRIFLMLCNSALSSYHDNWSPLNRNQEVESKFEEFFFGGHMLCFGIHWSLTADILWPCALGKYQDEVLCIPHFFSKHFFDHNHKFQRKILSDFPPISWINKDYHWKKKKKSYAAAKANAERR